LRKGSNGNASPARAADDDIAVLGVLTVVVLADPPLSVQPAVICDTSTASKGPAVTSRALVQNRCGVTIEFSRRGQQLRYADTLESGDSSVPCSRQNPVGPVYVAGEAVDELVYICTDIFEVNLFET